MFSPFYNNNPLLKKPRTKIEYTEHQLDEYEKCRNDVEYFCANYMKIVHVDKGELNFNPYKYQKELLKVFNDNRFAIVKAPRQSGKTTVTTGYILHYILFNEKKIVGILAHQMDGAQEVLSRIKEAYELLPKWLQQGVKKWNEKSIALENGCKILTSASNGKGIRGKSIALVYLDEFAHVETNIAEKFFKSVFPVISSGVTTKVLISSTPQGFNHFYKLWNNAVKGKNRYTPYEVKWYDVPGRDEKFKAQEIADHGQDYWEQEFEAEFLGSTNTLIHSSILRNMSGDVPILDTGDRQVYEFPKAGHKYNICVDVSRGLQLDYSAFNIMDVTEFPYRQVAKYRSNTVSSLFFPHIIQEMATQYNTASVLIEINDIGQQVADILHDDIEYENIITVETKGRKGQVVTGGFSKNPQMGVKTSVATKRIGCATLKTLVEEAKILIRDEDTINEFKNFIQLGSSYEADDGENDDIVMCLVIFAWLANQRYFREEIGIDAREELYKKQIKKIVDDLAPIVGSQRSFMDSTQASETDQDFEKWFHGS